MFSQNQFHHSRCVDPCLMNIGHIDLFGDLLKQKRQAASIDQATNVFVFFTIVGPLAVVDSDGTV